MALFGGEMTHKIILTRDQAEEIFRAVNGIGELLKSLPAQPQNAAVIYGIMSNLAVIQSNVAGILRVSSN